MVGRGHDTPTRTATFELESFSWSGPDRLELTGRFTGLPAAPAAAPVLIVRGADATHRLPAVGDSLAVPPDEGSRWSAEFAWQQPPIPFDGAELDLGGELVVALPAPGARRSRFRHHILEVRGAAGRPAADGDGEQSPRPEAAPRTGVERLQLEGELVAAQEELHELRAGMQRAQEELSRARADLDAERSRRAADADRFRQALERVQTSAAEAVAMEQQAAEQRLQDVQQALSDRTATVELLRGQLDTAVADRARADAAVAAELEHMRGQDGELRAKLERARSAADGARTEVEQLLARLATMRDELGDGT
jgi:hypothetical protein